MGVIAIISVEGVFVKVISENRRFRGFEISN
jgi:hypothetical protein